MDGARLDGFSRIVLVSSVRLSALLFSFWLNTLKLLSVLLIMRSALLAVSVPSWRSSEVFSKVLCNCLAICARAISSLSLFAESLTSFMASAVLEAKCVQFRISQELVQPARYSRPYGTKFSQYRPSCSSEKCFPERSRIPLCPRDMLQ